MIFLFSLSASFPGPMGLSMHMGMNINSSDVPSYRMCTLRQGIAPLSLEMNGMLRVFLRSSLTNAHVTRSD